MLEVSAISATLEENVTATEKYRSNINTSLSALMPVFLSTIAHSTTFTSLLGYETIDPRVFIDSYKLSPLSAIANILDQTNIKKDSFIDNMGNYPCYLYYSYVGYPVNSERGWPAQYAYTSNEVFQDKLSGDLWFYNYVTGRLSSLTEAGDYGRMRYGFVAGDGNWSGGWPYLVGAPYMYYWLTDSNYVDAYATNYWVAQSFNPVFQSWYTYGKSEHYDYQHNSRNSTIDTWLRHPWYANEMYFPKDTTTKKARSDLSKADNKFTIIWSVMRWTYGETRQDIYQKVGDHFKSKKTWGKNYLTDSTTDILVPSLYSRGSCWYDLDIKYKNNRYNTYYLSYGPQSYSGGYDIFNISYRWSTIHPHFHTMINTNSDLYKAEYIKNGGETYSYYTHIGAGYLDDEINIYTPLTRQQPVILIDDKNFFIKTDMPTVPTYPNTSDAKYTYDKNSAPYKEMVTAHNYATNSKIAIPINDLARKAHPELNS